jgi:predicted DsbA family dithiol-disulfide isomerase
MNRMLYIHFITDLTDPWCRIAQTSLDIALGWIGEIDYEVRYEPLNFHPSVPPGGRNKREYLTETLGLTPEQHERELAEVSLFAEPYGLDYLEDPPVAIYNTFDAHRVLRWAYEEGPNQMDNMHIALLNSYHRQHLAIDDRYVLLQAAAVAHLDVARVAEMLDSDAHAEWVRERNRQLRELEVPRGPWFFINDKHVLHGELPPRQLATKFQEIAAGA